MINKTLIAKAFLLILSAASVNNAFAQKSSGVISSQIPLSQIKSQQKNADPIMRKEIRDNVTASASASSGEVRFLLRPKQDVLISSGMTGTISKISFNIGERFKKGQVLVSLDCVAENARLQAQNAKVKEYNYTYKSNLDLLAGNAVSRYDVDIAKSQLAYQRALYSEAQAIASACKIIAPFTGGVVSVEANAHETVSSGAPVIRLVDDSEMTMSLNIPSTWINKVQVGNFFTIIVDETANAYKAKVMGVSPAIDPVSKTIELRAVLTGRFTELKPGMSGRARLNFSATK